MLSNNVRTTFSVEESDFPPVTRKFESTSNVNTIHSLTEERATSLNDLCKVKSEIAH